MGDTEFERETCFHGPPGPWRDGGAATWEIRDVGIGQFGPDRVELHFRLFYQALSRLRRVMHALGSRR